MTHLIEYLRLTDYLRDCLAEIASDTAMPPRYRTIARLARAELEHRDKPRPVMINPEGDEL